MIRTHAPRGSKHLVVALSLAAALNITASPGQAAPSDCLLFHEVPTYLADGSLKTLSVVVRGDRIVASGDALSDVNVDGVQASWRGLTCSKAEVPEGAQLAPGFIELGSRLGLTEVDLESRTRHHDAGGDRVRASHLVADSYDPRGSLIPVARLGGITSAIIEPGGGQIPGQAAAVDLSGDTQRQAVFETSVAVPVGRSGQSFGGHLDALAELLDDVRAFTRDPRSFDQNRSRPLVGSRRDLEALGPILEGELPLILGADRAAHIEALIRFQEAQDIRLVLRGGAEAWRHADALAAAKIPVILDPVVYGPGSWDAREARPDNAAILAAAGVDVLFFIRHHSSHFARKLAQTGGNAVRGGLPHAAAMRALTAAPAEIFGLESRGHIETGALANLVLWSGDPLELSSRPLLLLIRGQPQPLSSRQSDLRERYRTLPPAVLPETK